MPSLFLFQLVFFVADGLSTMEVAATPVLGFRFKIPTLWSEDNSWPPFVHDALKPSSTCTVGKNTKSSVLYLDGEGSPSSILSCKRSRLSVDWKGKCGCCQRVLSCAERGSRCLGFTWYKTGLLTLMCRTESWSWRPCRWPPHREWHGRDSPDPFPVVLDCQTDKYERGTRLCSRSGRVEDVSTHSNRWYLKGSRTPRGSTRRTFLDKRPSCASDCGSCRKRVFSCDGDIGCAGCLCKVQGTCHGGPSRQTATRVEPRLGHCVLAPSVHFEHVPVREKVGRIDAVTPVPTACASRDPAPR